MAELAKLEIQIGADVKDATKGIDNLNKSLSKLEFPANKLKKGAADASAALFSVSQVARDLPFGFIAIQNNLPQVVDSFAALSKQSGGAGKALKALGGALLGPAGIGFAFSALTSAATALISKYGSLAAGLDALFSSSAIAVRGQRELNAAFDAAGASVAGEIQTLQNLTNALADNNRSQEERKNAYLILKKEYPGIIQNMTLEKALTAEGTALIAERSKELVKYILLKGKEAAIIKLVEEETKKQLIAQREADKQSKNAATSLGALFKQGLTGQFFNAAVGLGKVGVEVDKAAEGADYFAKQLEKVQNEILGIDQQIVNFDKGTKSRQKSLDDMLKARLESQKKLIQQELSGVSILTDRWLALSTELQNIEARIKLVGVKDLETIRNIKKESQAELDKLGPLQMQARVEAGRIDFQTVLQVDKEEAIKRFADLVASIQKTGFEEAAKKAGTVKGKVEIIPSESIQAAIDQVEALKIKLQEIGNLVGGALADAFGTLWDKVATEGRISLQDVGNAVKKLVIDLIKAAIQAAILKIVLKALGVGGGGASGGLFEALAGKITGLASGGIVTKPTLAMIGEGGEKEAVIPLSKLGNIAGTGGTVRVIGSLRGSDLLLSNARETRKQQRG